jgi:hypothetical protein
MNKKRCRFSSICWSNFNGSKQILPIGLSLEWEAGAGEDVIDVLSPDLRWIHGQLRPMLST